MVNDKAEAEYDELSAFLGHFATRFWGMAPDNPIHPDNLGREVVARFGKAKALVGLRQAIHDVIEESEQFGPAEASQLDSELRGLGIVSLSELRQRHSLQYRTIRERGRIRDEHEFYLVKAILEETSPILDPQERDLLNDMLRRFESGGGG